MTTKKMIELINALLYSDGFSLEHDLQGGHLLDEEGERVVKLSDDFVAVLAELSADRALVGNVPAMLRQVYLTHVSSKERGFKAGERFGRAAVVANAHELLGINRIVEAIRLAGEQQ